MFNFFKHQSIRLFFKQALAVFLIFLMMGYFYPANKVNGATYTFTQITWSGDGTANTASHASNQSGWTDYSEKDASVTLANSGADLQLGTTASSTVQTNDGSGMTGFNLSGASFSTTEVSGTGDSAKVQLSSSGTSWSSGSVASVAFANESAQSSVAIGSDGFARIAHYYYGGSNDLKFIQCTNTSCSTNNSRTLDSTGDVGNYPSIALGSDGFARIAYYDATNADLKFIQCTNAACSTSNITTVDSTGDVGQYTSIAMASDGYARISYNDVTNGDLKFVQCTNDACSTSNISTVVATETIGRYTSLKLGSDGYGRISYYDATGAELEFAQCSDAACSTSTITMVDTDGNVGKYSSLVLDASDYAMISYDDSTYGRVKFAQCTNASCSTKNITVVASAGVGNMTSVSRASDGFARIAYFDAVGLDLEFIKCTNAACSTKSAATIESTGNIGQYPSIALGSDLGRISYMDKTNGNIKFTYEYSAYNSSGTYITGAINIGGNSSWGNLSWTAGGTGTITIKARSDADGDLIDATDWGSCTAITSGGALSTGGCVTNGHQYIQYQASLSTSDTSVTPTLEDVTIGYNIYASSATLTSSAYDAADAANVLGGISWVEDSSLPSGTTVTVSLRTAASSDLSGSSWTDFTNATSNCTKSSGTVTCTASAIPAGMKDGSGDRWLQYKVTLTSTGANTPTLSSVTVTYVVNAAPGFDTTFGTNGVLVSQISDSADANWGKVQIQYSVRDTDTSSGTTNPGYITPSFEYNIGGGWVAVGEAYLSSGAVTNKAVDGTTYTEYTAYWDAISQISGNYSATAQIRVTANDNEAANNTTSATSASFALDAAVPTLTSFTFDSTSNFVSLNTSDNTNIEYKISNNSDLSADGVNSVSGSWRSVGGTATNTSFAWAPTGSTSPEKIYLQTRDTYGNVTSGSLVAPAAPSNLDIKDVSNVGSSEYRLFIAWTVYSATTSAAFTNYKVYRSTDNSSYSLKTTITDADTNSYTDTSVASTTTYYYKVLVTDSDGDISDYSSIVTDKPDGQGGTDVTAPTISSVSAGTPQATWATITWTTDELSNSNVGYSASPSTAFGSTGSSDAYVTSHSVTLTGLTPNTTYLYRVRSTDVLNNLATDNNGGAGYSFTTAQGGTISNVATESANDNSSTITWNTNVSANSYVVYHTNSANLLSGSGVSEVGSATLVATSTGGIYQHRVTLSGLSEGTAYYYYVKSTDDSSNTVTDTNGGSYYSFKTTQDLTAPVISSVATPVISHGSVVITWQTDELADTWVEYGLNSGSYNFSTTRDSTLSIGHVATLTGLSRQTTYYYRVTSRDAQSNSSTSAERSVTTTDMATVTVNSSSSSGGGGGGGGSSKDTTPPKISKMEIADIGAFSAKVLVDTDETTVAFANFGENAGYGRTNGDSDYKKSHEITLSGLKMGTEYSVQAKVLDADGNSTRSENKIFKTPYIAEQLDDLVKFENAEQLQEKLENIIESMMPSLVPPYISDIKISDVSESSANVTWGTNVPAYSTVSYVPEKDFDEEKENPYPLGVTETETKSKDHKISLSGLSPSTTYHFQVSSFALPGVIRKSSDAIFITKSSKLKAEVAKLGNTEVEIRWVTPFETTSYLEYKDLSSGKISRTGDSVSVKNHSILLENLTADTPYEIRAFGYDGKNSISEADLLKIRTKKDTQAPVISSIKIDNALVPGRSDRLQTVISWKTDEPASSVVHFEEGVSTLKDAALANSAGQKSEFSTEHIVIITSLKASTVYRIQISSADEAKNEAKTPVRTILTPNSAESVLDVIIRNLEDSFGFLKKLRQ